MMKRALLFLFFCSFVFMQAAWAQERVVSGKVTSADDGLPIPGVNVLVVGTTVGTSTDSEGNYRIEVPATGEKLLFSFIGLSSQEVQIGDRSIVNVSLGLDITQLSEIVVTAAGIERDRKSLGYRMENVSGNKIQQVSENDPLRALQGKIAGVNILSSSGVPGSATRITMRGNRSLLNNNQPLIVVDGIPFDNAQTTTSNQLTGGGAYSTGLSSVDPNNIESINILPPGGAGAALYGVRAANGVIVITTKTGSAGASRKGLEIAFNSSYSVEEISGLPEYQNSYGAGTGFEYNEVNGSWGAPFPGAVQYPTITEIPRWSAIAAAYPDLSPTVPYRAYPNNVKDFFNRGSLVENSITLSGGNEKANFTSTISHSDQKGMVPNSGFKRTNISIGANTILSNKLSIGGTMSFNTFVQNGPPGGASNALGNGSAFARTMYLGRNWDLQGQPFEDPITNESIFFIARTQATNPYWSTKYDGFETRESRVIGNLNFGYDITEWLSASYRIGVTNFNQVNQEWFRPGGRAVGGIGQVKDDYQSFMEIESFLMLSANKKLNNDLTIKGFLAHNMNQRTRDVQGYVGTGLIDFNIIDIDNTTSVLNDGGNYERRRIVGFLGEAQIQYKDYLFLTINGRNDWSSTLPESNRSFFYPAVSSAFVFTDALKLSSKILTSGKLRASWTKVGNDADPYLLDEVFTTNPQYVSQSVIFPFNGVPGNTVSDILPDPTLTPEFTTTIELGTQLQFFNNRASLDLSVYKSRTTDGIAYQSLPAVSGYDFFLTNFGVVSNKGIEITANVTPISLNNSFQWNVNANFTHNRNVVEELAAGVDEIVIRNLFGGSVTPVLRPGQEYGLIRGGVNARDEDGNLLINPSNGQLIPVLQEEIIGNRNDEKCHRNGNKDNKVYNPWITLFPPKT